MTTKNKIQSLNEWAKKNKERYKIKYFKDRKALERYAKENCDPKPK